MRISVLMSLAVLLPVLAFGCGSEDDNQATPAGSGSATIMVKRTAEDVGKLVPADAWALLYVPSLEATAEKVRGIAAIADPEYEDRTAREVLEELLEIPADVLDVLDTGRPAALAVRMGERGGKPSPEPVLILPVTDAEKAEALFKDLLRAEPLVVGSYLCVVPGGSVEQTDDVSALAESIPDGDLALRVDLARLVEIFRDDIREALDGLEGKIAGEQPPGAEALGGFLTTLKDALLTFVDSAEGFDLSLSLDEDGLEVRGLFTAKEGSALAGASEGSERLTALAGCLPEDFPIVMLASFDMSKLMDWLEPMMTSVLEAMPEEQRGIVEEQMKQGIASYRHLGNEMAFAMSFGEDGMRVVMAIAAKDPKAYLSESISQYRKAAGQMAVAGVNFTELDSREVAGREVFSVRMEMDFEKLPTLPRTPDGEIDETVTKAMNQIFGEGGLAVHLVALDDRVLQVVGGDDALLEEVIGRVSAGSAAAGSLGKAIDRVGGRPKFLIHMEIRSFAEQIMALVAAMGPEDAGTGGPSIPQGGPIPLTIGYSASERHHAFSLSLEVVELTKLITRQAR